GLLRIVSTPLQDHVRGVSVTADASRNRTRRALCRNLAPMGLRVFFATYPRASLRSPWAIESRPCGAALLVSGTKTGYKSPGRALDRLAFRFSTPGHDLLHECPLRSLWLC